MAKLKVYLISFFTFFLSHVYAQTEYSVAREWNEVLLTCIRNDYARPTIHARNLFHISAAMYDAWVATSNTTARTYFLNNNVSGFYTPFEGFTYAGTNIEDAKKEAISYAAYRILNYRFRNAPRFAIAKNYIDSLMNTLGYNPSIISTNYASGSAAALGNYIARQVILFGQQDGSNELDDYENMYYEPINDPLELSESSNEFVTDPNRWQPLVLSVPFIDQSGNLINFSIVDFLSPEWGNVTPFALDDEDKTTYTRDGDTYHVYCDPGPPPYINTTSGEGINDAYKWGFSMVSVWGSHLNPSDSVMIDISPNSIGNISLESLPSNFDDYDQFYDFFQGRDKSKGYTVNPKTGEPYPLQIVPRGDYGRVLAEFWADGPDSETPPGHWYTILNYVSYHEKFVRKYKGLGKTLDKLEWDIKAYFTLGATMHDAAIASWSVKGYYDYIRPISAIRYMASKGQSTDPELPNYSPEGLPLIDGYIELVTESDTLVGENNENLNKLKVYSWSGHKFVHEENVFETQVSWILAEEWWPYQRPSFVTPPFAGYVSGHSTYSRAAAQVMTLLTGDEYFPNGVGEFVAEKNNFLFFEEGPSQTIVLQWAKYYDAADQCSLSRIWGGIHPPADDIPGRVMGAHVGKKAFNQAEKYINNIISSTTDAVVLEPVIFPNPTNGILHLSFNFIKNFNYIQIFNHNGKLVPSNLYSFENDGSDLRINIERLKTGVYFLIDKDGNSYKIFKD
ncbi:MAG: hypothetical protein CMO01_19790 [Thalassobius sp.]|nr:hypothetical protein [Thalassovita sp.]